MLPYEILYKICVHVDRLTLGSLLKISDFKSIINDRVFWKEKLEHDYPQLKNCPNVDDLSYEQIYLKLSHHIAIKIYYAGDIIGYILVENPITQDRLRLTLINDVNDLFNKVEHQYILLDKQYQVLNNDTINDVSILLLGNSCSNYISILKELFDSNIQLSSSLENNAVDSSHIINLIVFALASGLKPGVDDNLTDKFLDRLIDLVFNKLKLCTYLCLLKNDSKGEPFACRDALMTYMKLWFERKNQHHQLKGHVDEFISTYLK